MLKITVDASVRLKALGSKTDYAIEAVGEACSSLKEINKSLANVVINEQAKIKTAKENIQRASDSIVENVKIIEALEPFVEKDIVEN